jgi:hypothetical protein
MNLGLKLLMGNLPLSKIQNIRPKKILLPNYISNIHFHFKISIIKNKFNNVKACLSLQDKIALTLTKKTEKQATPMLQKAVTSLPVS